MVPRSKRSAVSGSSANAASVASSFTSPSCSALNRRSRPISARSAFVLKRSSADSSTGSSSARSFTLASRARSIRNSDHGPGGITTSVVPLITRSANRGSALGVSIAMVRPSIDTHRTFGNVAMTNGSSVCVPRGSSKITPSISAGAMSAGSAFHPTSCSRHPSERVDETPGLSLMTMACREFTAERLWSPQRQARRQRPPATPSAAGTRCASRTPPTLGTATCSALS